MTEYVDLCPFNVLSLCSGIGGIELGLKLAVPTTRTIGYVEREAYCCEVLVSRMEDEALDAAPVWTDLATFDGKPWRGVVDCLISGYPCQPFSVAGQRKGTEDPRHLWPHIARIIRECEPEWCFFENVANHLNLGFPEVARELQEMGYRVAANLFTAAEIGAPHKRERLFILAHNPRRWHRRSVADTRCMCSNGVQPGWEQEGGATEAAAINGGRDMADAKLLGRASGFAETGRSPGQTIAGPGWREREALVYPESVRAGQGCLPLGIDETEPVLAGGGNLGMSGDPNIPRLERRELRGSRCTDEWTSGEAGIPLFPPGPADQQAWESIAEVAPTLKPAVRGVADRTSTRVDRLRALGNGVVPIVAAYAFTSLYSDLARS